MGLNKEHELQEFRQKKLQAYINYVEEQNRMSKDAVEIKSLKRQARELKADITQLEKVLNEKETMLDDILDRLDYLKQNNVKKC